MLTYSIPVCYNKVFEIYNCVEASEMINEKTLRIGFVGCGKMAQALAKGFIASGSKFMFCYIVWRLNLA